MSINNTIETYKRRKQLVPFILGIAAILLVLAGIIIVVVSLGGGKKGGWNPFASKTPTPTITFTPSNTPLPTDSPTITPTPTQTATVTPSAPYTYEVQQGDSLYKIVQDRNLGDNGIVLILLLNPYNSKTRTGIDPVTGNIFPGQIITLPNPGMTLPSPTPWPTNAAPGTRINYFVLPGDSLGSIANKLRSTVDDIVKANKTLLTDGANTVIYPGWILVVPVNLVTPIPPSVTHSATPTVPAATATPTRTP